ncbi:MAG TPA: alpha-amylase family protein, partial [Alphaproteobacteria bacterium]|nr:alpha-amylase family protein [Alphaproteobacteria bacterium]
MISPWWMNGVVYCVDVARFCDSNGDGYGDFPGLTSKIPYLADLGVTCLWLLPFQPSGGGDNGYDITDHFGVDPHYGTLDDFLHCQHKAGEAGIRVVTDLVLNHTSIKHPWFQAARNNPDSRYRDYYYWAEHPSPPEPGKGPIFPEREKTVWTYDETARAYYYHRFYRFQPSLNILNPEVQDEIKRIIDYWTSFGISGFRIDAARHMLEPPFTSEELPRSNHAILQDIYQFSKKLKADCAVLGEADSPVETLKKFFEDHEMDMMFNFLLNKAFFESFATASGKALRETYEHLPRRPGNHQWVNFLRNMDELSLEGLSKEAQEQVYKAFAPDENMRVYGRGIRRRVAPLLGGDLRRIKLAVSLLFACPGVPCMVYGDEIGMGDDLSMPERQSVRLPMQWSAAENGGFSTAPKDKLIQPMIENGPFGFKMVNVESQQGEKDSLLEFIRTLVHLRNEHPSIGLNEFDAVPTPCECILALRY